ncbi:uncharacterized protein BKCO1_6400043 [Diplodia corticola]|uniref:Uncharacterized protein n=1 Tax=Diplodia corticola TaxID=236234 RepID=A0A1J9QMV5_9PEZI|nr:uncharacterized protein BKCO1_6400043 [Diplodia corticola]OJD30214.1 hypothetical protein BKCO1_6400043 [Diplodia corticola]
MVLDPDPDSAHPGYETVIHGEVIQLPLYKDWNTAASKYEEHTSGLAERYASIAETGKGAAEVIRRLALPWSRWNYCAIKNFWYKNPSAFPDEIRQLIMYGIGGDPDTFSVSLLHFRERIKRFRDSTPPEQVLELLENCVREKTSWSEQDLALDTAVSSLPLASRISIDVAVMKGNYQLFLVAITNAFPIPEDQFDYHLRRYHALRFAYSHIHQLIRHYRDRTSPRQATIPHMFLDYAWLMYTVILRFLYHSRTFDPENHLKDRTLYGWTTGILWKLDHACRKFREGLRTLKDDHSYEPGDEVYDNRMGAIQDFKDYTETEALEERADSSTDFFKDLLETSETLDVSPEFIICLRDLHEQLREAGLAADILRSLPHSADPTFLGMELDGDGKEEEDIRNLYDRMRYLVDVREYASCEEHGGIGDW